MNELFIFLVAGPVLVFGTISSLIVGGLLVASTLR
jgi:hypothetical protein